MHLQTPESLTHPAVISAYGLLEEELLTYLEPEQVNQIHHAITLGSEAHVKQIRQSGEPYFTHPLAVAHILATMHLEPEVIMAGLLHDTIEDNAEISTEILAEKFGVQVAQLVDGVTKLNKLECKSHVEAEAQSFTKMLLAMSRDIRVILIKLSDRLHNMRTIGALRPEKRKRIARETLEIYAPIAQRLGISWLKNQLQDLSFKAMDPEAYRHIHNSIKNRRGLSKTSMAEIESAIRQRLGDEGIEFEISSRVKSPYSIYRKMGNKHLDSAEILDVFGFRIVVPNTRDCYVSLGIMHNLYTPIDGRFKDYIANMKANGYQSLHTVLKNEAEVAIEVQIRTRAMDIVAHKGIAAHWAYDNDNRLEDTKNSSQGWLIGLLQMNKSAGNPEEFLENLRQDLYTEEVHVFSPKGKIFSLPLGSTAIDFAYAVHTGVGDHCVSAWVDGHVVPLTTQLESGQTVRIITAESASPQADWLSVVGTVRARTAIRSALRLLQHEESINLGHRMLDRELDKRGLNLEQVDDRRVASYLNHAGFERLEQLLADIGRGNRMPSLVARKLMPGDALDDHHNARSMESLYIDGTEGNVVSFALCCHPIPGDDIMGHISAGKGVVIHREHCSNAIEYKKSPDLWINTRWANRVKGHHKVALHISSEDRPGMLARVGAIFAQDTSNIEDFSYKKKDGRVSIMAFTATVRDRTHLANLIRDLRKAEGVTKVQRV